LPVIENTQDWNAAASKLEAVLREHAEAHGFLIRRHGLYTWGSDLAEAKRQIEILEFLFEVMDESEASHGNRENPGQSNAP